MIGDHFSAAAFEACGIDSPAANDLAQRLAVEIQELLQRTIQLQFKGIIDSLNMMGHNLRMYGDALPGDISYRDDYEFDNEYTCKLRVGIDLIVSTGYSNLAIGDDYASFGPE